MAAPSQTRTLWLTFGAAAATLVVVAAVVAGPSLVNCYGKAEGLLACLRQDVVDVGLLPSKDVPSASEAPIVTPEPPPAAVVEAPAGPELSLIRAEPDGSLIVAGTGKPGISVQVFADNILIGQTKSEPNGDWVVIPDKPIITGGAEITVGVAGGNSRSAQSFVIVINSDRKSEPLVVASTPGEASKILQGLPEIAPTPAPDPAPVQAAEPAPTPITEPTPDPELPASDPANPPPNPPIQVAEAVPEPAEPATPNVVLSPLAPPTIDAIEIDGHANFFAGAGPEGATIRLYVDDRFVADAKVEGGRWLVEASGALTLERQRVRIDMLKAQTAEVAARAEVNFVIDLPSDVTLVPGASGTVTSGASAGSDIALAAPALQPQVEDEAAAADPEIPTMTASPSADPEKLRFASGKAIIRRGENLWTIARRVYGDGMKYTTIFDANKDQMRTPEHIYPGQVFDLPAVQDDAGVN